jgi:hypothetical protein
MKLVLKHDALISIGHNITMHFTLESSLLRGLISIYGTLSYKGLVTCTLNDILLMLVLDIAGS